MNWRFICNAIGHEMWKKLASALQAIISNDDNNININDIDDKTIKKVLKILSSKRRLEKEPKEYMLRLIKKTQTFTPIINNKGGI